MNTATLSPPPRPPRSGNIRGGLDDSNGGGKSGGEARFPRWGWMIAKLPVLALFLFAAAQLAIIMFQTVRLWFFA